MGVEWSVAEEDAWADQRVAMQVAVNDLAMLKVRAAEHYEIYKHVRGQEEGKAAELIITPRSSRINTYTSMGSK